MPRNTTNIGCIVPSQGELQTTSQGNRRGHKQMEKHSMLMVKKNEYCENGHTAQSNFWREMVSQCGFDLHLSDDQ